MKYIEEDIVTIAGLLAARCYWSGVDHLPILEELARDYEKAYDDNDLEEKFSKSFRQVLLVLPKSIETVGVNPKDKQVLVGTCHALSAAIQQYDTSGKRRRRFLGGTLFSRSRNPIRDVEAAVEQQILTYAMLMTSGKIVVS